MDSKTPTEVVIPLSKGKVVLLILGALTFVAGSIWIWSIADGQTRYNPLYVKAVAIAGVSFFGLCAIYGCLKVFDTQSGLIIDDQGIVDNSSAVAAGRILWNEVVALNVSEIAGQRFITVVVTDPQKICRTGQFPQQNVERGKHEHDGQPDKHLVTITRLEVRRACSSDDVGV